jgi:tetratricopeptide (TPR) repeat protein
VQAYSLYLQGAAQLARNSDEDARRGIKSLEEAVARDPQFGQAWLMLSVLKSSINGDIDSIDSDARRAEELNPALAAGARTIRAAVEARRARWLAAEALLQGITVEDSLRYEFFALPIVTRWATGRLQKVIEDFETATRLAPAHGGFALNLAMAYAAAGRPADASRMLDRAVTLGVNPDGRRVVQLAASIASQQGRFQDAAASMAKALSVTARETGGVAVVRDIYEALGQPSRRAAAVSGLQAFLRRQPADDWVVKVYGIHWYAQLGRPDLALATGEDLRKLLGGTLPTNAWAWLWQPEMRETQRAPGFGAFVGRLGMVPYWEKYGPPDGCELKAGQLSCA